MLRSEEIIEQALGWEAFARFRANAIQNEGVEARMYLCPAGKHTIGIGHNLDANPISPEAIEVIFRDDTAMVIQSLNRTDPSWTQHPEEIKLLLMDLMLNLGESTWKTFVNTRAAFFRKDYRAAAAGLRNSRWYNQVGDRAVRAVALLNRYATEIKDA